MKTTLATRRSPAFDKGRRAYHARLRCCANPYRPESQDWYHWRHGWRFARAKHAPAKPRARQEVCV
jgi:hypothetical protein